MKSLPLWLTTGLSALAITTSSPAVITPRFSPSGDPLGGSTPHRDSSKRAKPAKPDAATPRLESQLHPTDANPTLSKITRSQKAPVADTIRRFTDRIETAVTKPPAAPGISIYQPKWIVDSISSSTL
jgi:hypothetical protein